jgi:uncharacterized protein (TIGR03435 family)
MRLFLFAFLAVAAAAQTTASPAFEVASVKINADYRQDDVRTWRTQMTINPGTFLARNFDLKMLIAWAYDTQRPQVIVPDWVEFHRYDIQAKSPEPARDESVRPMLQTLLAERFKLRIHRETREMEVLALVVPKGGHKMAASKLVDEPMRRYEDPVRGQVLEGAVLSEFIKDISRETSVPVVDLTGLQGRFYFPLNPQKYVESMRNAWRSSGQAPSEAEARIALLESLVGGEMGLKLEKRKVPVEVIVIDAAEKTPVEN